MSAVFDPHAWEERLSEARIRRAAALARINGAPQQPPSPTPLAMRPPAPIAQADDPPLPVLAASSIRPSPDVATAPVSRAAVWPRMAAVFAGGLALGLVVAFGLPSAPQNPPPQTGPAPLPEARAAAEPPIARAEAPQPAPASPAATPQPPTPDAVEPERQEQPPQIAAETPAPQPAPAQASAEVAPAPSSPDPALTASRDLAPEPTAAAAPDAAPALSPPATEAAAATRVLVHAPADAAAIERAAQIVIALQAEGYDVDGPLTVNFTVSRSNARFFHPEDAAAAQAVAALVGPAPEPALARDFTHMSPRPDPGAIELWIAGTPPSSPGPARVATSTPRPLDEPLRAIDDGLDRAADQSREFGARVGRALTDLDKRIQRGLTAITR